jgi:hypothetical protein
VFTGMSRRVTTGILTLDGGSGVRISRNGLACPAS